MASDGYLSRDKERIARLQRQRRARMVRLDYAPSKKAQAVIEAKRAGSRPGSASATNRAVLDAIVIEWATLTGIEYQEVEPPEGAGQLPELADTYARTYEFGAVAPDFPPPSRAPARLGHSTCGAQRHRDGQPCRARAEPGKRRCRFHGGRSTGPKSAEGKARALANLSRGGRRAGGAGKAL